MPAASPPPPADHSAAPAPKGSALAPCAQRGRSPPPAIQQRSPVRAAAGSPMPAGLRPATPARPAQPLTTAPAQWVHENPTRDRAHWCPQPALRPPATGAGSPHSPPRDKAIRHHWDQRPPPTASAPPPGHGSPRQPHKAVTAVWSHPARTTMPGASGLPRLR